MSLNHRLRIIKYAAYCAFCLTDPRGSHTQPNLPTQKAPKIPCLKLQRPTSPTIKPFAPHPTIVRTGCAEETNHASLRVIRSFPRDINWHTGRPLPLACRERGLIIEETTISSQVRNRKKIASPWWMNADTKTLIGNFIKIQMFGHRARWVNDKWRTARQFWAGNGIIYTRSTRD